MMLFFIAGLTTGFVVAIAAFVVILRVTRPKRPLRVNPRRLQHVHVIDNHEDDALVRVLWDGNG